MEEIIANPIDSNILKEEFKSFELLGHHDNLAFYIISPEQALGSQTLLEIGRLREIAFRRAGGGTGNAIDISAADKTYYYQLICVNVETNIINGGYRFALGSNLTERRATGDVHKLYEFPDYFGRNILANSIELGRSFVNHESSLRNFILDLIWGALAYLFQRFNPTYTIGKLTFYPEKLQAMALDLLCYFLSHQQHNDFNSAGVRARSKYQIRSSTTSLERIADMQFDWTKDYYYNREILFRKMLVLKQSLKPFMLLFKYIGVLEDKAGFAYYDTAYNHDFGSVVESLITIKNSYIAPNVKNIHLNKIQ